MMSLMICLTMSLVVHSLDLVCQVGLQNSPDQVSTQMHQDGTGHVDSQENHCQAQGSHPRRSQLSLVVQAVCHGMEVHQKMMVLQLTGAEPHPQMM